MSQDPAAAKPCTLPLALYVHTPWCVSKCGYCDFNSHAAAEMPFDDYVSRLLEDLDQELSEPAARRPLVSVYIGGGTPSLFPGPAIQRLIAGVQARAELMAAAEISIEVNPGTVEASRLEVYRQAGIDRLSIGAQSFSPVRLRALGRIHGADEVRETMRLARAVGFNNINLDLMFALPGQDLAEAARDLDEAIALGPEHLSYYQLTLEPNTRFFADPPPLPDADLAADMSEQGQERLALAGYRQYEVSAYARAGWRCRHNLNYWEFGDYLGIGAGAHGKLSWVRQMGEPWRVRRTAKRPHPRAYLEASRHDLISSRCDLDETDLIFEHALNALRLTEGFAQDLLTRTTGLTWSRIADIVRDAEQDGLLRVAKGRVQPTLLGRRFVDDLVARFAPDR